MSGAVVVRAKVVRCGASAKVTGWEVLRDDFGLVPHADQPTPEGIRLLPLFTLDQLSDLLAGGATVHFEPEALEVGALDYQCAPTLVARELDADLLAWGAYGEAAP